MHLPACSSLATMIKEAEINRCNLDSSCGKLLPLSHSDMQQILHVNKCVFFYFYFKSSFEDCLLPLHKQLILTIMVIPMMRSEQALKAQISLKKEWYRHPSHACLLYVNSPLIYGHVEFPMIKEKSKKKKKSSLV